MTKDAFESAVERHQHRVFTFASYFLADRSEAEDVTQEVLIKLWRKRAMIRSERLGGWLLKVTRNACYDRLRRRQSAARVFSKDADEAVFDLAASAQAGPEELTRASELKRWLGKAVSALNEPQRSIVILREIQGLSYQEICEVLGLPITTVRVALHRARRRLRESLREVHDNVSAA
ncbi:MAG: sigma-70 family RNA polymerase sigma factor [bacterium]|nr:sigma-70 family RNA polymerase sigma factor [bacterium]